MPALWTAATGAPPLPLPRPSPREVLDGSVKGAQLKLLAQAAVAAHQGFEALSGAAWAPQIPGQLAALKLLGRSAHQASAQVLETLFTPAQDAGDPDTEAADAAQVGLTATRIGVSLASAAWAGAQDKLPGSAAHPVYLRSRCPACGATMMYRRSGAMGTTLVSGNTVMPVRPGTPQNWLDALAGPEARALWCGSQLPQLKTRQLLAYASCPDCGEGRAEDRTLLHFLSPA